MDEKRPAFKLHQMLFQLHSKIEHKECQHISRGKMAERLGVSSRAYTEYLRGTNEPLAMKALLRLLAQSNDADLLCAVRQWAHENPAIIPEVTEEQDTE